MPGIITRACYCTLATECPHTDPLKPCLAPSYTITLNGWLMQCTGGTPPLQVYVDGPYPCLPAPYCTPYQYCGENLWWEGRAYLGCIEDDGIWWEVELRRPWGPGGIYCGPFWYYSWSLVFRFFQPVFEHEWCPREGVLTMVHLVSEIYANCELVQAGTITIQKN